MAGTELTESTVFGAAGEEFFTATYGSEAKAQIAIRRQAAESGIVETLGRIRAIVEGATGRITQPVQART